MLSLHGSFARMLADHSFEDDFDVDGFALEDIYRFALRRQEFWTRRLTATERDEIFAAQGRLQSEVAFFETILDPECFPAFMALIDDKENPVRKSTIEEIAAEAGVRVLGIEATPKSSGSSGTSKPKKRRSTGEPRA